MAQFNTVFDATTVKPQESFTPLPAGTYIAQITDSAIKPTKSGSGTSLNLTWTILDGQYANRKVFDRINVQNLNPEAEQIGQRQLSAVCHAVGVLKLQDSNQLHGRPIQITVKIRKDEQWGDSNEVKGYQPIAGGYNTQASGAPFSTQQPAAAAPAASVPPWAKSAA